MARFDVYAARDSGDLLLDCQSDTLDFLQSRFVVPLLPRATFENLFRGLNPVFSVGGADVVMATQFAASIPLRLIGERAGSLVEREWEIMNAIDMLLTGH